MSPLGPVGWHTRPSAPLVPPVDPGADVPLQSVLYSNVGQVNPFNVTQAIPCVQGVAVPTDVNVPQGVYGVRVGSTQLAVQARTVKHRPNGNACVLRLEGVWPESLTEAQTISLTALPPDVTPEITVDINSGNLRILRNSVVAHTIAPYAATNPLSGNKIANLKGSNTSAAYIPSVSFHEWHVARSGSATSVGAAFQDLVLEEDTPILKAYLARGKGETNTLYEFQMRVVIYKYRPWVKWEYTTFKHFNVNLPGETGSNPAISSERITITPSSPFTNARMKSTTNTTIVTEANPYGAVTGTLSGSFTDTQLNAIRMAGPVPLSVGVRDFMGFGPCAIRATMSNLILDFWSQHTSEVLDFRGTGTNGEEQCAAVDYNSSPRGTARTWEGFFSLEDDLPLAQKFVAKDDIWFMTAAALEASQAWGPLKAAAGTALAPWWKRVNAFERAASAAAERHQHYGYAQLGLTPSVIPNGTKITNSSTCDTPANGGAERRYVAREPMHSGRYGQSGDSYGTTGEVVSGLLTQDRSRLLSALQASLIKADINGHHGMIFGSNYMGSNRDGIHRRYRDPWTGKSDDFQYFYPESQYTSYWAGGARRHIERAEKMTIRMGESSSSPYVHRPWAWANKYMYTHASADLTKLNQVLAADITANNNSSDYDTAPVAIRGTPASMMWGNFRYGHNVCAMIIDLYEATGTSAYLDQLANAYRLLDWSYNSSTGYWARGMSSYGQHVTPFHALCYLRLRGYSASDVSTNAMNSMQQWVGDNMLAGTFRNHNLSLPAGDPNNYSWSEVLTYFNAQVEEGAGFQLRFGPMIASWYAS